MAALAAGARSRKGALPGAARGLISYLNDLHKGRHTGGAYGYAVLTPIINGGGPGGAPR